MKRKIILFITGAVIACAAGVFAACNTEKPHEHTWNGGEVTTPASCSATGIITYSCTGCDETYTEVIPKTEHPYSDEWLYNEDEHWHATTCEHTTERANVGEHDWGDGEVITPASCLKTGLKKYTCVCGKTKTEVLQKTEHNYSNAWTYDEEKHWHVCLTDGCTAITDESVHNWDDGEITTVATCQTAGVKTYTCTDCGRTKTVSLGYADHNYSTELSSNENSHYYACTTAGCTAISGEEAHVFGEWQQGGQMVKVCTECEYEQAAPSITANSGSKKVTVGNNETAGITLFTMSKGYYTVKCTTTVNVAFVCEYYEWDYNNLTSVQRTYEFTVTPENNTFTVKLGERSVAYITAESDSQPPVEITVWAVWSETAPEHTHIFSEEWSYNSTWHWHACIGGDNCDEEQATGEHEFDENGVCTVCGYNSNATTTD